MVNVERNARLFMPLIVFTIVNSIFALTLEAQKQPAAKTLFELQHDFVDLRFGMFIHFKHSDFHGPRLGRPRRGYPQFLIQPN